MTKIFVKAPEKLADECIEKAYSWLDEENQHMFDSCTTIATRAVAEYLANEKGFTLYEVNAKYPRKDG